MTRARRTAGLAALAAAAIAAAVMFLLGGGENKPRHPPARPGRPPAVAAATRGHAVAVDPSGRAVAVVERVVGRDWRTALMRQGDDAPFGDVPVDGPAAIAAQADGKLLVAGYRVTGGRRALAVARVQPDGGLDGSFGDRGVATVPAGSADALARGLAVATDGRVVVAGDAREGDRNAMAVATLDAVGRALRTELIPGASAGGAAADASGRVLVAGTEVDTGALVVARIQPDGALDAGYGNGGAVRVPSSLTSATWCAIAARPDGGAVIVGSGRGPGARSLIATAVLGPDASLAGASAIEAGEADAFGSAVTALKDGTIVAAGTAVERDRPVAVTVPLRPDGSAAEAPVRRASGRLASIAQTVVLTTIWDGRRPRAVLAR